MSEHNGDHNHHPENSNELDSDRPPVTTFEAGAPAPSDDTSLTAGRDGVIALHDAYVVEKMQQFNRERVPERVVHAKGSGAHGYFEVTDDATSYTYADLFAEIGRRTEVFVRFSQVAGEQGYADTPRDPRGFAVKFYTRQGNWDLVGNNTPVFFMRDPSKFQDFIRSQKRLPHTGMRSNDMQWDYWTLSPESAHQVAILMSDHGTPQSYRHMNGYGSHTFSTINAAGEKFWVKYHFLSDQGERNLSDAEAKQLSGVDPDHHRRDLYDAIDRGDFPSWQLMIQAMPFGDAADYRFNPFDVTKVWPHADYPLVPVGRLLLDRNPENFFAEVEQSSFNPSNLVPGLGLSPDKMLLARVFSYHDTHLHRIGTNYQQLPINAAKSSVHSYNKEGAMTYRHSGSTPVYAPSSYGGPRAEPDLADEITWWNPGGEVGRYAYRSHSEDDDAVQARALYRDVMDDAARAAFVANIVSHAGDGVTAGVRDRVVHYWRAVDQDLAERVASGLRAGPAPADPSSSDAVVPRRPTLPPEQDASSSALRSPATAPATSR